MSAEPTPITRPRPLQSLVASAKRITSKTLSAAWRSASAQSWQDDAWDMYDLVGEQRFLATTLSGRMAQAGFYVGTLDESQADPVLVDAGPAYEVLEALGDGSSGRSQLINRLGLNLFIAGEGWLVGLPPALLEAQRSGAVEYLMPDDDSMDVNDLMWRTLSVSEVAASRDGLVTLHLGESDGGSIRCHPEDIYLIRVWRPHPRRAWEADSPTRSSLAVLRELVGLTMHISAQVDSRLAGAGLLVVPQSAQRALNIAAGLEPDAPDDTFTEALMEAMLTPIGDRANASALVPLVVTVPDDVTDKFSYMNFAKPLDTEARNLRDEAIRRLALGQDAPPELLLGTAGMNHWGAWLVQEDVVTTHLEPPLALICDALTTQYLWPVLVQQGMTPEQAQQYVVWYDVSKMITRPNRSADALTLHDRGIIDDSTLRKSLGFDDTEASAISAVDSMLLEMVKADPGLLADPGAQLLREQLTAIATGAPVPVLAQEVAPAPGESPTLIELEPDTETDTVPEAGALPSAIPAEPEPSS